MKSGLKERKVIIVVLVYHCGCGLSKFAHTHTRPHICKHGPFCSLVNFKSPSSHGYHYAMQIREEKNPLRLHRRLSENTPWETGVTGSEVHSDICPQAYNCASVACEAFNHVQ